MQSAFRVHSECIQSAFRVHSECIQSAFRVHSECIQSAFRVHSANAFSECRVHAQTEYKGRHDKLAKVIHWDLCKRYGVKMQSKWYDHVPEKVEETDRVKILWDFNIQTDHVIEHRRPDVVVLDKHEKMCHLIDIAVPGDSRVEAKENEKVQKYQDLARELRKLWQVKVNVVPVVVGALGTIPKALEKHLKEIGTSVRVELLQKAALLGTARILRKTLEI